MIMIPKRFTGSGSTFPLWYAGTLSGFVFFFDRESAIIFRYQPLHD